MSFRADKLGINNYCSKTIMLMVIYAIQSICGGIAFYISLFLKSSAGLDPLHISIVIAANSMGNILGSFAAGYISDKYNPSYSLKIGLFLQGIGLLTLVFSQQFYTIFFIMGMMGLGSYLYITSSLYMLNSKFNNSSQNRTKIISTQYIISNIGMFFSAILMGYCAAGYYPYIFVSLAILVLLIAITLRPFEKDFYLNTSLEQSHEKAAEKSSFFYLVGLAAIGIIGIMYSQYRVGYPVFLQSNFGNINTGFLMAMNPLIILFFQNLIIKHSSKFNEITVLAVGLLFFSCSFLLLNYPSDISLIFIACSVLTIGEILAMTYAHSITFGHAPLNIRGRILGIYKAIYSVTKTIGAFTAGAIINYKGYHALWSVCGAIGITGFLFALFIKLYSEYEPTKVKAICEGQF